MIFGKMAVHGLNPSWWANLFVVCCCRKGFLQRFNNAAEKAFYNKKLPITWSGHINRGNFISSMSKSRKILFACHDANSKQYSKRGGRFALCSGCKSELLFVSVFKRAIIPITHNKGCDFSACNIGKRVVLISLFIYACSGIVWVQSISSCQYTA